MRKKRAIIAILLSAVVFGIAFGACQGKGGSAGSGGSGVGEGGVFREQPSEAADDAPGQGVLDGIPRVPEGEIRGPSQFDSEEDRERYEAGEWHTDALLRERYGFKSVAADGGGSYVAGEMLVYLPGSTTDEELVDISRSLGCEIGEVHDSSLSGERRVRLVFDDALDIEAAAEAVGRALGADAEPNAVFTAVENDLTEMAVGVDPDQGRQDYLGASGFQNAWRLVRCEQAVKVAVLDSGIDADHPDLSPNIDSELAYNAITEENLGQSSDRCGHGTVLSAASAAFRILSPLFSAPS